MKYLSIIIILIFNNLLFAQQKEIHEKFTEISYLMVEPSAEYIINEPNKYQYYTEFSFFINEPEIFTSTHCYVGFDLYETDGIAIPKSNAIEFWVGWNHEYLVYDGLYLYYDGSPIPRVGNTSEVLADIGVSNLPNLMIRICYDGQKLQLRLKNVKIDFVKK
jgi:hypothetical protein